MKECSKVVEMFGFSLFRDSLLCLIQDAFISYDQITVVQVVQKDIELVYRQSIW